MTIKAKLTVKLFADSVLVAESERDDLWRSVLEAIDSKGLVDAENGDSPAREEELRKGSKESSQDARKKPNSDSMAKYASDLGVRREEVEGACGPEADAPFLRLDVKTWERFKSNHAGRGKNTISPTVVAATLLCLWFKSAGIGRRPTQKETLEVLDEIGIEDGNASRSVKRCVWLQSRPDGVQINPAKYSQATSLAKAFVTGTRLAETT